ncbi:MAG TPA: phage holin family protein [Nitrospira sp.]|nr:phage holin family protein [Nitrospira sp.]
MAQTGRIGLMDLLTGILDDFKSLLRQEVQLLRDEVKLEVSKAGRAASDFGVGIGLAAVGGLFLLLAIVHSLHEGLGLPLWASYGIVGVVLSGIGIALLARARSLAGSVEALPRRTMVAMKENVQWIKERMTLRKT